jgi:hypothetical protein
MFLLTIAKRLLMMKKHLKWPVIDVSQHSTTRHQVSIRHIMPEQIWKANLRATGHNTMDTTKTLSTLCDFFSEQEEQAELTRAANNILLRVPTIEKQSS